MVVAVRLAPLVMAATVAIPYSAQLPAQAVVEAANVKPLATMAVPVVAAVTQGRDQLAALEGQAIRPQRLRRKAIMEAVAVT